MAKYTSCDWNGSKPLTIDDYEKMKTRKKLMVRNFDINIDKKIMMQLKMERAKISDYGKN